VLVAYGTYVGDGVDNRSITGVGFQPDIVIVHGHSGYRAGISMSNLPADTTKPLSGNLNGLADAIQAFESDGFQIGTSAYANNAGVTYYYLAIKTEAANCSLLSYVGNGVDNRSITGAGFAPDMVIILKLVNWVGGAVWHTTDWASDTSGPFDAVNNSADRIQAMEADGFQIGTSGWVNTNGDTYYALCLKHQSNVFTTLQYAGNGADNRSITGAGFQPDGVLVKSYSTADQAYERFLDEAGDDSMGLAAAAVYTDRIQAMEADGFQVGTAAEVNSAGVTYNAALWKELSGYRAWPLHKSGRTHVRMIGDSAWPLHRSGRVYVRPVS
jgi:hypothetical protein